MCKIVQNCIYDPYGGQGLDLGCLEHDCDFKVETADGDWSPKYPDKCPIGSGVISGMIKRAQRRGDPTSTADA